MTLLMAGKDLSGVAKSSREMGEYLEGIIELRRKQPAEDLISALVEGSLKEDLTAEEVIGFCRLLLVAGNETTTNLIGNGMIALLENPEQLRALRERPRLEAKVVLEELFAAVGAIAYAPGQRGNVPYMSSGILRGPTTLQLSIAPA